MTVNNDYENLIAFWNTAFEMSEADKQQEINQLDTKEDWKKMAPSEKLLKQACALAEKENVLDYGCGSGWAAIAAAKSGCKKVTGVDTAASAVEMARFYGQLFEVNSAVRFETISVDWLENNADDSYDGIICSNVLDVIPEKATEDIISQFERILTDDGKLVIGMNYYMVPAENEERHITVKNGNCIYIDGILRLVSRTDEQWQELFEKYFTVESLEYFSWPNEEKETRRLFVLRKKTAA